MSKEIKVTANKISGRQTPEEAKREELKKEAAINLALQTRTGLDKIAAALANPVRKHLDYAPIGRGIAVTETIPDGAMMYYDNDIEEWSGALIGKDGASHYTVVNAVRTIVPDFQIVSHPKIPYRELKVRKYKVFDRIKQRLRQALAIKEDLYIFSLLHTAATQTNSEHTVAGPVDQDTIALVQREVEKWRLLGTSIITNPDGISCIRRWDRTNIDEVARIEIRQTGYLGNLWGANFYVTNLIEPNDSNQSYFYVTAAPEFVAWMPIRADAEIIPADQPGNLLLGFVGYELLGMVVHNSRAVGRGKFNLTT